MDHYENTKFLLPYLGPREDEIKRRVVEYVGDGDQVQRTADVLRDLITSDPDVRDEMVEAFWQSIDWRLLADMYLGRDMGSSV